MTAKEAIRELEQMKQYTAAKSIPVLDYAIKAIQDQMKQEQK